MSMANLMKKINWNNRSVELSENSGAIRNYFDIHSEVKIMEIAALIILDTKSWLLDIAVFTHERLLFSVLNAAKNWTTNSYLL